MAETEARQSSVSQAVAIKISCLEVCMYMRDINTYQRFIIALARNTSRACIAYLNEIAANTQPLGHFALPHCRVYDLISTEIFEYIAATGSPIN